MKKIIFVLIFWNVISMGPNKMTQRELLHCINFCLQRNIKDNTTYCQKIFGIRFFNIFQAFWLRVHRNKISLSRYWPYVILFESISQHQSFKISPQQSENRWILLTQSLKTFFSIQKKYLKLRPHQWESAVEHLISNIDAKWIDVPNIKYYWEKAA